MAVDKTKIEEETSTRRFYKIVLSWDYLRLLKESSKNSKNTGAGLKKVKDTYKNVEEYLHTFEPLLFEEVKAQMVQGKDDEEKAECMLALTIKCSEADGFHLLTFTLDDVESVSQNDLILLSDKQFGGNELPSRYAFGSVEHRQDSRLQVTVRMQLSGEIKSINADKVEPSARLSGMQALVSEVEKPLYILKICSLSTIVREYVALRSISSLPFKDLILSAAESNQTSEDQAWKVPKPLMESIQNNHNKSQLEAIHAGLSRRRFVLIQGPPGTGKTQTILGLLSAILHATPPRVSSKGKLREIKRGPELPFESKFSQWEKASPWLSGVNPRDAIMPEDGDDGFFPTSGNEMKPEVVKSSRKYRVRVLVCAPSNSALDEIVVRLLNTGLRDENDRPYNPKIVRIGLKAHHSVQTVSMDYIMEQKLSGMDFGTNDKTKQGGAGRERDTLRASILDEAAIVFSTLSFSGSSLFSKLNRGFDVVIIDEAAQAVEAATLVPLANGCKQVFLVGDPVQLPATVISPTAEKLGYGMSLFKRFQKAGYGVVMLKTQYRMHPEIRSFPSREFYNGELEDGADVVDQTKRDWHEYGCFGPFCFFDIHEGKETQPSGSGSWVNEDEVNFVLAMYHSLVTKYPVLSSSSRLAIISPYRHQVKLIRERFKIMFGVESEKVVDINTVDGFQGREKDVAIFSCVRSSKDKGIGFVADFRRMNVGITRARSAVLVVGSATTLKRDEHWKSLVESAEERKSLYKVSKPYKDFFSEENLKSMKVAKPGAEAEEMETDAPSVVYGDPADADAAPVEDYGDGDGDGGYDMGGDDD